MDILQHALFSNRDSETTDGPPRKVYEPPAVMFEANLEVRAGSPLSVPLTDPDDPLGILRLVD